jgi:integrase
MKKKKEFGIFRNTDTELAHWWVKLSRHGRRHSFDLGTHIKADALKRAREIYLSLHANGWEVTLSNFSDGAVVSGPPTTVGEFCDRVTKIFDGSPRTINDYCQILRRVAADIAGMPRLGQKFANPDYDKTLEKINKLKLSILSLENLVAWRKNFVDQAGNDPLAQRSAKTSANSYIRQLKSLFSKKRLKLLKLEIDSPIAEMEMFTKADMRFRNSDSVNPVALFKAALAELEIEPLKALVLMLCAGLRKNEADKITWSAINWQAGNIHVGPTKYLSMKSEKSIGSVDLDEQVMALFRAWRALAPDDVFILKSDYPVRLGLTHSHYRAAATFSELTNWLRTQGFSVAKPLHTLRKLFGDMLNDRYGLHVASLGLRHADIGITAQHYVSKRSGTTVGLGSVIAEAGKVVEFGDHSGKTAEKELAKNAG